MLKLYYLTSYMTFSFQTLPASLVGKTKDYSEVLGINNLWPKYPSKFIALYRNENLVTR